MDANPVLGRTAQPPPLASAPTGRWPHRYKVVGLFFLATVLCYLDRVSISVAIIPLSKQNGYDSAAQGLILSAFFWGYLWPQLAGGFMADRYGGRRVLAAGVALWSIATFATPIAASTSFGALLAVRVMLGLGEGVNFPAIHSLTARWTPTSERARVIALNFSGMHLGTVIAFLLSPPIIVYFGWPALFYISGAIGVLWVAAWLMRAGDRPEDSRHVSAEELAAITRDRAAEPRAATVPWGRIAREKAVWVIVLAHFCSNFGFNILLLWLPTYLHNVFKVPLLGVGAFSLIPWIATFATGNAGGWIADSLVKRGVAVETVRKTMQTVAFTVGAVPLLALPAASSPVAAIVLITISAAGSGIGLSAFGVNHLDVGPTYAGVLMGISNTIATIPGIIGVAAAGLILQATGSFTAVFYLIAVVYLGGMLGYAGWASGERKL